MDGMIAMLPDSIQGISTEIDFVGQRTAERTYQVLLVLSGIIGFCFGFYFQQLSYALYFVIGTAVFCAILVLPPWPFLYKKDPIEWQSRGGQRSQRLLDRDEMKDKKKTETKKTR